MSKRDKRKKMRANRERQKAMERRCKRQNKNKPVVLSIEEEQEWRENNGIIHCWNCKHALKIPEWIRKMAEQNDGPATNSSSIRCKCKADTTVKF